jgi:acyl-CoA synthetase (AMP-forming)/AMP-acid ligase II
MPLDPQHELAVFARLVERRAADEPDRLALTFENGELPAEPVRNSDLAAHGNRVAWELRRAGLRPGDRVGVMLRNHPEFVHVMVAASKLALTTVPIDPRARGDRLRYFIDFAGCSALVAADYTLTDPPAADVIGETGVRTYALSTAEGRARGLTTEGWPSLSEVLESPEREDVGQHVDSLTQPWFLSYTSGTTGDPKAIAFGYDRMLFYRLTPDFFGYRSDDVPYTGLSLIHGNALVVTLMPALWGVVQRSVLSRWFTKSRIWDVCIEHGCTTWSNLGGIATAVYGEPPAPHDRAHQVRLVVSAGMPRDLWRPFEERFGVRILEWYGTMEGGFARNPVGVGPVGSFGRPPEGLIEMEVVDEQDQAVPPGTVGELILRPAGQAARLEYHRNPEASARKTRGGWLHTGDMCWEDDQGWLFFSHRKEEGGLRRLGEFVQEGYLRRVLAEDPEVLDVHVYGVPARSGAPGECDVVAAVVARDPAGLDVAALWGRCARRLDRAHLPDYLQVMGELPKTATEKVQTRVLVESFDASDSRVHARGEALGG